MRNNSRIYLGMSFFCTRYSNLQNLSKYPTFLSICHFHQIKFESQLERTKDSLTLGKKPYVPAVEYVNMVFRFYNYVWHASKGV